MIKTYSEMIKFKTYEERLKYLECINDSSNASFGTARYLKQRFYRSKEWKKARSMAIIRDNACDLGCSDRAITDEMILVHHINPITKDDIININTSKLLDLEYLITTIKSTHEKIHHGEVENDETYIPIERHPNDTCPWKR